MAEPENGTIDLGNAGDTDLEIGELDMDTVGSGDESEWIGVDEFGRNTD